MTISFDEVLPAVRRDLNTSNTLPRVLDLIFLDATRLDEVAEKLPDPHSWLVSAEQDQPRLLLLINDNVTALDEVIGDPERILLEVASNIQDFVNDHANTVWPTAIIDWQDGKEVGLDVGLNADGRAYWCYLGHPLYRVGDLNQRTDQS